MNTKQMDESFSITISENIFSHDVDNIDNADDVNDVVVVDVINDVVVDVVNDEVVTGRIWGLFLPFVRRNWRICLPFIEDRSVVTSEGDRVVRVHGCLDRDWRACMRCTLTISFTCLCTIAVKHITS